jgi:hypothetical protein
MRWPWVSRRAYDQVVAERDRALEMIIMETVSKQAHEMLQAECARIVEQNDRLIEHLTRMDRLEHGVTEEPRLPRKQIPPMPNEIRDYIKGFASDQVRREIQRTAYMEYREAGDWEGVLNKLRRQEDEPDAS